MTAKAPTSYVAAQLLQFMIPNKGSAAKEALITWACFYARLVL
jgi:hypothetical protein